MKIKNTLIFLYQGEWVGVIFRGKVNWDELEINVEKQIYNTGERLNEK